jgi:hypothetical protein
MTEKAKLVDLIQAAVGGCSRYWAEVIANHLLANGVIVPPCKVDDDTYWIDDEEMVVKCAHADVKAVCYYGNGKFKIISRGENEPENIGTQWCMLTKEEAENALAKMKGGAE